MTHLTFPAETDPGLDDDEAKKWSHYTRQYHFLVLASSLHVIVDIILIGD